MRPVVAICGVLVLGGVAALASVRLLSHQGGPTVALAGDPEVAGVGQPVPLPKMARQAASIWRGSVVTVAPGPRDTLLTTKGGDALLARRDRALFQIERVLKGREVSGVRDIAFYVTPGSRFLPGIEPGQRGLVFLDNAGDVVDPARPIVLLGPGGVEGPPPEAPFEAVKQEMLACGSVEELVYVLNVDFAQVEPVLRRMAMSPDDATAGSGLRALAHYPCRPAVSAAVEIALARGEPGPHCRRALFGLQRHGDPQLAPLIEPLLDADVPEWRLAALAALGYMRSRAHIPRFAAALDDPDPNLQYQAVRGLMWAVEPPRQPWMTFRDTNDYVRLLENPAPYAAKWKHWWESEGRARYGKK